MDQSRLESLLQLRGCEVQLTLSNNSLSWTFQKRLFCWGRRGPTVSVPVNEIVKVHQGDTKQQSKTTDGPSICFTVYHISRKSAQRWTLEASIFTAHSCQEAHDWVTVLQDRIQNCGAERPQKLLIFINPYGGSGKAVRIYNNKISPLFQLAGIKSEVIETTRANHARDYILETDLQKYDGVVCVGGDGMFSELLHGVVRRTQSDNKVCENKEGTMLTPCKLRIGIIPAGSTDCVCFATVGINDPVTSALHIIIGDTQPMDVCASYHYGELMRYSVSLIGYGFFGDVLRESETLRCLGPIRYDLSGFKMVLSNRFYRGTVEFLEADDSRSSPTDNTRCRTGCQVCTESSERWKEEIDAESHCCDSETWQKISGSFVAINVTGMSSACPKSLDGLSPTAHLADGTADLILVRECNMLQFVRHLKRHTNKKDQFALPYVEVHRIRAMQFTPEKLDEEEATCRRKGLFSSLCGASPSTSSWNCDGEILDCAQLSIRFPPVSSRQYHTGVSGVHFGCHLGASHPSQTPVSSFKYKPHQSCSTSLYSNCNYDHGQGDAGAHSSGHTGFFH